MSTRTWAKLPEVDRTPDPIDASALALAAVYSTLISVGVTTSPRSLQTEIGASEIGSGCDRQISYKANGIVPVNYRDPLRLLAGTGMHLALAEVFDRVNANSGRFLVEYPVSYRGLRGHVDLYDRQLRTVVDWKSSTLSKIRHIRHDGVNAAYRTQVQCYAAGLREAGEDPLKVAILFVPFDGTLEEIYPFVEPVARQVVDDAIDRYERIAGQGHPANVTPTPSRLCPWCDHYRPGSKDLTVGCPGPDKGEVK